MVRAEGMELEICGCMLWGEDEPLAGRGWPWWLTMLVPLGMILGPTLATLLVSAMFRG